MIRPSNSDLTGQTCRILQAHVVTVWSVATGSVTPRQDSGVICTERHSSGSYYWPHLSVHQDFRAFSGLVIRTVGTFVSRSSPCRDPSSFLTFLTLSAAALPASAQVGKNANQPYEESSAGRAMQRITFARHRLSRSARDAPTTRSPRRASSSTAPTRTHAPTTAATRARQMCRTRCCS